MRPGAATDLLAVLQAGLASGWTPRRIVHLWQVTGKQDRGTDPQKTFDDCLGPGFDTLTALVQALHEHGVDDNVDVTVVADGLFVLGREEGPLCWEKASLMGPCRVVPKEMPAFSFQLIEVPADAMSAMWLADALLAEAAAPESGTVKALRVEHRYIETFQPLPDAYGTAGLRTSGVVLLTGGTGGLGLELAGRLFDMAQMRLVLLSRWPPPPVEEWPERARATDRIGEALRKVLALQARGADVMVSRGDAALADDMKRVIDDVRARFGAIHGVVHAAGSRSRSLVLETDHEMGLEAMSSKVHGALILEELLGDEPLDFFVSFSSLAAVAPRAGQVAYSSANAVLDALAMRREPARWARVCSIGWDAWQDVGMAADAVWGRSNSGLLDLSHGPVGEAVDHPMWQYCRHERNRVLFAGILRPAKHWVVAEHQRNGVATMPGTGILELVHAAFRHLHGTETPVSIGNVAFRRFLEVPEVGVEVWLSFGEQEDRTRFELRSCTAGTGAHRLEEMTLHSTGDVAPLDAPALPGSVPGGEWRPLVRHGSTIEFGPHWNHLLLSELSGDENVMRVALDDEHRAETQAYALHPALLDRALGYLVSRRLGGKGVPSTIGELRVYRPIPASVTAVVRASPNGGGAVSMVLIDERGEVVAECEDYLQVVLSEEPAAGVADKAGERRLRVRDVGDLNTVELVIFDVAPPGVGEVQIEVYAAGLNFRDVLTAVGGMSDDDATAALTGAECSGRIVAIGPDVSGFVVGDAVMAVGRGVFATRVNVDARLVAHKPDTMNFRKQPVHRSRI